MVYIIRMLYKKTRAREIFFVGCVYVSSFIDNLMEGKHLNKFIAPQVY